MTFSGLLWHFQLGLSWRDFYFLNANQVQPTLGAIILNAHYNVWQCRAWMSRSEWGRTCGQFSEKFITQTLWDPNAEKKHTAKKLTKSWFKMRKTMKIIQRSSNQPRENQEKMGKTNKMHKIVQHSGNRKWIDWFGVFARCAIGER